MSENRQLRVFLCHSSNDKPAVRELHRQLSAEGWMDVWLDEEKLYPGQDWNLEIEKAVEAADAILVCLSNNSITKEGYVQRELRIVLDYADYKPEGTLYLIPIRLEKCDPPRRLRPWQYADYFEKDRDRAYQRLLVSLRMRANSLGISVEKSKENGEYSVSSSVSPSHAGPFTEKSTIEPNFMIFEKPRAIPAQEEPKVESKQKPIKPTGKYTPDGKAIYTIGEMEFVKIPAGKFLMGSREKDKDAGSDEKPQHNVDLLYEYYMGRFPVTNEQYAMYIESKGGKHPVSDWKKKRNHPVVRVLWSNAMAYCKWLDDAFKGKLPAGLVLRLPTEAEWEKAARGNDGRIYPWGDSFDQTKCNTVDGGNGDTTPLGAYSPQGDSPYGCADMSGNVSEWTHSIYKPYPYQVNDGREDINSMNICVLRGGSYANYGTNARCAERDASQFSDPFNTRIILSQSHWGFRMAVAPDLP